MNYIIFDLEATCWKGRPPGMIQEIIEIGAYRLNAFGEIEGRFSKFVRPVVQPILSPFCRDLTSITQEQVRFARKFPDVLEDFIVWADMDLDDEEYVLVSWGNEDKRLLLDDCHLHRVDTQWLKERHIDLKDKYQKLKRLKNSPSLLKTVEVEGFEFTGIQHRAIYDAENLLKIFLKYIDRWDI
jgi:3'-5' exoribonuclease 1